MSIFRLSRLEPAPIWKYEWSPRFIPRKLIKAGNSTYSLSLEKSGVPITSLGKVEPVKAFANGIEAIVERILLTVADFKRCPVTTVSGIVKSTRMEGTV